MMNRNLEMIERVDALNKLAVTRGFEIRAHECFKNNNCKVGYSLCSGENTNAAPTVYFDSLEEIWDSDDKIVDYLADVFENNKIDTEMIGQFTSREYILSNVKPKVISNTNLDEVVKNEIVYYNYLDMLVLFQVEVKGLYDDGIASYTIKQNNLSYAHIGMDELYNNAIANLEDDFEIKAMTSIIMEMMGITEEDEEFEVPDSDFPMWVVTNKSSVNGASVILSEKLLRRIEEKLGEKFAILPSSIHECIAVPLEKNDASDLLQMVCEVNATEVDPEDRLTNSVYIYKDGKLSLYE